MFLLYNFFSCILFFFFFLFFFYIFLFIFFFFFFFFSSRRRHTRYIGDWSSDVCSSDLLLNSFQFLHYCNNIWLNYTLHLCFHFLLPFDTNKRLFQNSFLFLHHCRSEERRVGKECISWVLQCHCNGEERDVVMVYQCRGR